jgi:Uma2 family endonuclease
MSWSILSGVCSNKAMTAPAYSPELIDLLPLPGEWTEADYYPFSERGRLVELSDGNLEIIDLPTDFHQLILVRLSSALHVFVTARKLGHVRFAPLPVRLWSGKIREPDLMFMSAAHASRIGVYWGVPDLAVEILSPGSVYKDREIKREEYAKAGVAEYWIVDPEARTVDIYKAGKHLTCADVLASDLFEDFSMPLAELFADE